MAGELILIVEDNDLSVFLVREVLQLQGYQTVEATTAEEGIEIAITHKPALIVMDIQLPGMNGIAALAQLRAEPVTKTIPVIAVTASVMLHDIQNIREAGFDTYQTKPISVKVLIEAIRNLLDKKKTLL